MVDIIVLFSNSIQQILVNFILFIEKQETLARL